MKDEVLRGNIMKVVRTSEHPSKPMDVAKKVSNNPKEEKTAREVIRSLVDRGDLQVTLDWKLRAGK